MEITTLFLRAIILMSMGIFIANIIIESNIMNKLQFIIKPICIKSHLPKECVMSILTCLISPSAGKTTLSEFYRDGKINKKEVVLTAVMSTFATVVGESLIRIHAPIAIVFMGPILGGIYILLGLLAAFIQSFSAFLIARYIIPPHLKNQECSFVMDEKRKVSNIEIIKNAFKKATVTIKKIFPIMIVTFLSMHILINFNFMEHIRTLFEPIFLHVGLPGESVTVLIAQLLHFSAGYATVSLLLTENVLTSKQAIISLLIGNILMITLIYVKFSFPMYISLFGKFGMKIAFINYMASIVTKILIIFIIFQF
jgi:hypothetical protein